MNKIISDNITQNKKVAGCSGEIWLPVALCSKLLGIRHQSIRESIKERSGKFKEGRYVFRIAAGKGGKQYEILLSSLPESIQTKYWLEHHKPPQLDLPAVYENQENQPFDHETYEGIADSYNRKPASMKAEAQRRVLILDEYFQLLQGGFKKEAAADILANRHKKYQEQHYGDGQVS